MQSETFESRPREPVHQDYAPYDLDDFGEQRELLFRLMREPTFASARTVVARRHADMHHADPALLVARRRRTADLCDYGYLREADTLCDRARERIQARNPILGETASPPGCVL